MQINAGNCRQRQALTDQASIYNDCPLDTTTSSIQRRTMASTNDALPTVDSSDNDELEFFKMRGLRFRVLILGRANAGKTTILERLAGASATEAQVWQGGKLMEGQVCSARIIPMFLFAQSSTSRS